ALAREGADHGTVVVAEAQTAGRGTSGRAWSASPGGYWFSVVVRPPDREAVEVLPIRCSLVLASMLESWFPDLPALAIRCPNDLLLAGKKVAGILWEARWSGGACQWVVVGVGINHRNPLPEELHHAATRIADHSVLEPATAPVELLAGWIAAVARRAGA